MLNEYRLNITFSCENAAFEDLEGEIRAILGSLVESEKIMEDGEHTVRDSNGNKVGEIGVFVIKDYDGDDDM